MHLHFPIRVPGELLEELGAFTGQFWSDTLMLEPHICEAIRNYIDPPPVQPQSQTAAPPGQQSELGYQWKEVFLPEGTRLRATFGKKPWYATVQGAEIKYGEHAVSPSCFANLYGSGNRNAWKAIWLRLPGSDAWLLADVCRAARKASIARLMASDAREEQRPAAVPNGRAGEQAPQPRPPSPALAALPASRSRSRSPSPPASPSAPPLPPPHGPSKSPSWLRPRVPAQAPAIPDEIDPPAGQPVPNPLPDDDDTGY
nr:hypothetical protein [uncultured Duganella sp.]